MKWSELPNTLSKEAQKHLDNALQSSKKQAYGYKGDILVDNIEKEFIDAPLSNQETLEPFYMIYVDGASGSTKKHDYESACKEAYRLSKETDKKVFILRSNNYFERNIEIKNTILK